MSLWEALEWLWTVGIQIADGFVTHPGDRLSWLALLTVVWPAWVKWLRPALSRVRARREALDQLIGTAGELGKVVHQFRPAAGASVPEQIARIAADCRYMRAHRRAMVEIINDPIFETDAQGKVFFASQAFAQILDVPKDECKGTGWAATIVEAHRERVLAGWRNAVAAGIEWTSEFLIQPRRGFGDQVRVRIIARPMHDDDGIIFGWLGHGDRADNPRREHRSVTHRAEPDDGGNA